MSRAFGPPLVDPTAALPGRYKEFTNLGPEDTVLNHWWLQHDVHVSNSDWTREKALLLSPSKTSDCRRPHGTVKRCTAREEIGDSPVIHAVMKKHHHVITEELPVQTGFTMVELEIWPNNLLAFNPNILSRYGPKYSERFHVPYGMDPKKIYTPPYSSEWEL